MEVLGYAASAAAGFVVGLLVLLRHLRSQEQRWSERLRDQLVAFSRSERLYEETLAEERGRSDRQMALMKAIKDQEYAERQKLIEVVLDQARAGRGGTGAPLDPMWHRSSLEEGDDAMMRSDSRPEDARETTETIVRGLTMDADYPMDDRELAMALARQMRNLDS